ncbi:MAG: RluA family pseudouridine synthase [bacterium]|nr:RluA family pseudouridine synthase [bacterium]
MPDSELKILYQDVNLSVVNKPAGLLVHPIKTREGAERTQHEITLVDLLLKKFPKVRKVGDDPKMRPGIVHRLDKDTSGVMIVALNQASFEYLKKQFQEHKIVKNYLALAHGHIQKKQGTIDKPLGIAPDSTRRSTLSHKMVKSAITDYRVVKYVGPYTLLSVTPRTGRTHQIRVHLISIGHPIVGDKVYGRREVSGLSRQFLHAESIEFTTPQGSRLKVAADLPEDLQSFLNSL